MPLLRFGFGLDCVLRLPLQKHPAPPCVECLRRRRLQVLAYDDELAAVVEIDDVAREHARVDDVADPSGDGVSVVSPRAAVRGHTDLLRPDREGTAGALENVRRTDEAGDEGVFGALVDGGRRANLLDLALVED